MNLDTDRRLGLLVLRVLKGLHAVGLSDGVLYLWRVSNFHQIVTKLGGPIKHRYSHVVGSADLRKFAASSLSILSTIHWVFHLSEVLYCSPDYINSVMVLIRLLNETLHEPRLFIRLVKNAFQFSPAALFAGHHSFGYGGLHHR